MSSRALCAIGGLGALGAVMLLALPAVAASQQADACAPVAKWKAVFPRVAVTDFAVRWPITYHRGTRNHWPGTCGGWFTTYSDYRGTDRTAEARVPTRDFAQVSIVALSSRAAARAAYAEALSIGVTHGAPVAGALMKSAVYTANGDAREDGETATVVSLIRNVVVISNGEGRPADNNGTKARREQERVHRAIQRNVIALR